MRLNSTVPAAAPLAALLTTLLAALAVASPASAQAPVAPWSGSARCELQTTGPGYSDRQTHTWTITGAPAAEGAFLVHPGTWTVTGGGALSRSNGSQTLSAQWTRRATMSGPIAMFVRASDGRLLVQARHAQLRQAGGVTGTQTLTTAGAAPSTGALALEAFEFSFPAISDMATTPGITGSSDTEVAGSFGPMQPGGSRTTASCVWSFSRSGAAAALPAPTLPPPTTLLPTQTSGTPPVSAPPAGTESAAPPTAAPSAPPATGGPGTPGTAIVTGPPAPVAAPGATVPAPGSTISTGTPGGTRPGGTFTAVPGATTPPVTPVDPAGFIATQSGEGTVRLQWQGVPGVTTYMVGGPGAGVGVQVTATSHTLTGVPAGQQTWTVASVYAPGGVLTTADRWSRATAMVTNSTGRYRIAITGFRALHETFDDRLFGDGDEVYASAAITTIDRRNTSVLQPWTVVRSATYGDTSRNPERVQAGSFSPTGGIRTGDVVPTGTDPQTSTAAPSSTRLPLAVWEGTLRDGIDAVVVNPVLWESDGGTEYYNLWMNPNAVTRNANGRPTDQRNAIMLRATAGDLRPFAGVLVTTCHNYIEAEPDCKPGNDRPIGLSESPCLSTSFLTGQRGWCDVTVVFTREGIERALSSTTQVGGRPAGIIAVPFADAPGVNPVKGGLDGNYEMFIRVERLP